MAVRHYQEYKTASRRKKRVSKKKLKRVYKIKRGFHNLFSFVLVLFIFPAAYFLIWGLMIEPNLPRHIYGPGDLKEFIYLMVSLLIISVSYLMILFINYKAFSLRWWNDLKLLASAGFSVDKYNAMKSMGIKYERHKKQKRYHRYQAKTEHKSITQ